MARYPINSNPTPACCYAPKTRDAEHQLIPNADVRAGFRLFNLTHNMADLSEQYIAQGRKLLFFFLHYLNGIALPDGVCFMVVGGEKKMLSSVVLLEWEQFLHPRRSR